MRTLSLVASLILATAVLAAAQETPVAPPNVDDLIKAARAAYVKGDYAAARASLETAWAVVHEAPPSDPKRYEVAKQLEGVLSAAGDYKAAQEYEELAINWRENVNGQNDPKLADEWIELSNLCQRLKDFTRGLLLLQRAQSWHMREYGQNSITVADDWSRIALLHTSEQRLDQAVQALQIAIRTREAVLGTDHPAILSEVDRLASAQITLRYYSDAEETFRRALVIRERLTGPMHVDLIATVEGLAYAQFGQKNYDDAENGYKRLLALWFFATKQPDHPMIALTYDKIATFYRAQKRWEEGADAASKAIALRGLFLANALQNEASEQIARENSLEGVRLLQRALDVLDPAREEHTKTRESLQAVLKEMVPEASPAVKRTPARTLTTKSTKKQ
jgi:tetratricopeptide (TPR) repeat protein